MVQTQPVPVEGHPQQADACGADRDQAGGEPRERVLPGAGAGARPHAERLSAPGPAPAQVHVAHREQPGGVGGLVRTDRPSAGGHQHGNGRCEQQRGQQYRVVEQRSEPPEYPWTHRRCGCRRARTSGAFGHAFGSVTPRCPMYLPVRSR